MVGRSTICLELHAKQDQRMVARVRRFGPKVAVSLSATRPPLAYDATPAFCDVVSRLVRTTHRDAAIVRDHRRLRAGQVTLWPN